jgi:hypothetical protein
MKRYKIKRKEWKKEGTRLDFPFLPILPSGTINPTSLISMYCGASQIKIFCSRHPFTLQRDAKGSAWPIPFHWNKVYSWSLCMYRAHTDTHKNVGWTKLKQNLIYP